MLPNLSNFINSSIFGNLLIRQDFNYSKNIYFIEIHPCLIKYISIIPERANYLLGPHALYGTYYGSFDYFKRPFNRHFMSQIVMEVLRNNKINETQYYKKLLKKMSKKDADNLVSKLYKIKKILREKGYLSQYELGNFEKTNTIGKHKTPINEMIIGLDRNGEYFRLIGGRHRLALAQQLGLEKIYAIISLTHRDAEKYLPNKCRVINRFPEDFRPF